MRLNAYLAKFSKFIFAIFLLFLIIINFMSVPAVAKCPENVVPNPLDPNCQLQQPITLGMILNRISPFIPIAAVIAAVSMLIAGAFVMLTSQNEEGRRKAIQFWINAVLGLVLLFSIWLILFLISIFTGVDLLSAIGQ
jgi:hypothetical protein